MKQKTISKSVSIFGHGIHTGVKSEVTIHPAKENHGIVFQRIDLEGQPTIPADVDYVVDTSRCTVLGKDGATVSTSEHLLAALRGLSIDNALIQINAEEVPIMDGSSKPYINKIKEAGLSEQNAMRSYFEVTKPIFYNDKENDIEIVALPMDSFRVTTMIDYNSTTISSQHAFLTDINDFESEISTARTFCLLSELETMYKRGLVQGGDPDSAVVIVDKIISQDKIDEMLKMFGVEKKYENLKIGDIINTEPKFRFKNEPARHKLLDVVGDLSLSGVFIKGQIIAVRPGHAANVAFAKKIKESANKIGNKLPPTFNSKTPILLDINEICTILPHRYPFLLIDNIFYLDETTVAGIKNVTYNEPFFQGHFPNNPVMPGVLLIEALAQIGGILVLNTVDIASDYWAYFMGVESFKFRKLVLPGDTLVMRCELLQPIRRGIAKMKGVIYVGDTLVSEGVMSASLVKKDKENPTKKKDE